MSSMVMSMRLSSAPVRVGTRRSMTWRTAWVSVSMAGPKATTSRMVTLRRRGFGGVVGDGLGGGEDDAGHGAGDALDHLA